MNKLKIYIAKIDEFDEFYDFFANSLKNDFPHLSKKALEFYLNEGYSKEVLRAQFQENRRKIFLARYDKDIVGYLLSLQDWGGINIGLWLAVKKDFRGKGIGKDILDFWEKDSIAKNHALFLYTSKHNRKFYKHLGFSEAGKLPNFWYNNDYFVYFKHIKK